MKTLEELIAAYKTDSTLQPLTIDNDDTHVYQVDEKNDPDWLHAEKVFSMDPDELLEKLLDYVGIPHEPA